MHEQIVIAVKKLDFIESLLSLLQSFNTQVRLTESLNIIKNKLDISKVVRNINCSAFTIDEFAQIKQINEQLNCTNIIVKKLSSNKILNFKQPQLNIFNAQITNLQIRKTLNNSLFSTSKLVANLKSIKFNSKLAINIKYLETNSNMHEIYNKFIETELSITKHKTNMLVTNTSLLHTTTSINEIYGKFKHCPFCNTLLSKGAH